MIFVFGSNTAGRHGKGAALTALRNYGAVYGQAEGLMGQSYALPTCDHRFQPVSRASLETHFTRFAYFVVDHPELKFKVTRVGCGLGKRNDADVAPYFLNAPSNCFFDEKWHEWLGDEANYWGTF